MIYVHRAMVPALVAWTQLAAQRGVQLQAVSGYRSERRQRDLRRVGRPALVGSRSKHTVGAAVDFRAHPASRRTEAGLLAEAVGLEWGGRYGEPWHVEMRRWP